MPQEILNIILGVVSVVVTGLVGWGVTALTTLINSKIKDKKASNYLNTITTLTANAVKEVYQTYAETLKKEGKFDSDAQKIALENCLKIIQSQLAPELITYITDNFGDMKDYLISLIESTIYSLKN